MKALIDADILRYEIGFACELGWKNIGEPAPWWYCQEMFDKRIERILRETGAETYQLFLSGKENFRNEIAKTKVYKGTRKEEKPPHFNNLTAYIKGMENCTVTEGIEADDAMSIEQIKAIEKDKRLAPQEYPEETIICSRDKDLRQVPGWHYGWEIGAQPSFGPKFIDTLGWIDLDRTGSSPKLKGGGYKFFCSQLLTGDIVDNIPGLPKCGAVGAFDILKDVNDIKECFEKVCYEYGAKGLDTNYLLEQGRLLWLVRRYNEDGTPEMWELGQYE
jgi:5'-3' exonuclease